MSKSKYTRQLMNTQAQAWQYAAEAYHRHDHDALAAALMLPSHVTDDQALALMVAQTAVGVAMTADAILDLFGACRPPDGMEFYAVPRDPSIEAPAAMRVAVNAVTLAVNGKIAEAATAVSTYANGDDGERVCELLMQVLGMYAAIIERK